MAPASLVNHMLGVITQNSVDAVINKITKYLNLSLTAYPSDYAYAPSS